MGNRLSLAEAKSLGLLSEEKASKLQKQFAQDKRKLKNRLSTAAGISAKSSGAPGDSAATENPNHPQFKLFNAIEAIAPGISLYEATNFVPGRKFRLDIFLPESMLVVEMDGFAFHRSKTAFQKDRDRQLLLVELGCTLINVYNAQVQNDTEGLARRIVDIHCRHKAILDSLGSVKGATAMLEHRRTFIEKLP